MMDSLFAIVRRDPGTGSMRVLGDLFVTAEADCLDRIIETTQRRALLRRLRRLEAGELATELEAATGTSSRSTPPRRSARTRARCGTNWSSAWATATRARRTCTAHNPLRLTNSARARARRPTRGPFRATSRASISFAGCIARGRSASPCGIAIAGVLIANGAHAASWLALSRAPSSGAPRVVDRQPQPQLPTAPSSRA